MQKLGDFNNDEYVIGRGFLAVSLWYITNVLFFKSAFPFYKPKTFLLKLYGAKVGKGVKIKPHVNIKYPWKLILGNDIWIGEGAWIDNLDIVTIESNCCLSQKSMLLCGNHNYKKRTFDLMTGPITIKEGAWICANAMVGPGVVVAENAILKPFSFASHNLERNGIYEGAPAVKIKNR